MDLKNQNLHHSEQKEDTKCWSFKTSYVFLFFLCTYYKKNENFMYLRIYVVHWNFGKEHKYAKE